MGKKYISNKDETVRMFDNDFLEALSRVHFSVPLIIFLPVVLYCLYLSAINNSLSNQDILFMIILGLIVWTLTEYSLHRFIFHYNPKTKFGEKIHFIFHGVHHDYPSDSRRLVMPPSVSVPLALVFYYLYLQLLGINYFPPFYAGFIAGYLCYDMTHYAVHHLRSNNKLFLFVKKHHMKHHYQDETKGFGVSQPIWDRILKTDFEEKIER